jgi:hypothetical protein
MNFIHHMEKMFLTITCSTKTNKNYTFNINIMKITYKSEMKRVDAN